MRAILSKVRGEVRIAEVEIVNVKRMAAARRETSRNQHREGCWLGVQSVVRTHSVLGTKAESKDRMKGVGAN